MPNSLSKGLVAAILMNAYSKLTSANAFVRPLRRDIGLMLISVVVGLSASARAVAVDPAVVAAEQRRVEVVSKASEAVVAIFGSTAQGGGSGVLISKDGYALSNFHVTSSAGDFMKCGLNDGVLYDAVIVGIDPTGDVALLKLLGRDDFPHATFGDSDNVEIGDWVYAMGNPFLLATDFQPTVTYGIVSGVHRYQYPAGTFLEYTDCIQVDASINPGNSGGPLFNAVGELVGINGRGSFEKRGRVNSGAGYAISINQIKNFSDHLRSGRVVDHATLGATVSSRSDGAVIVDNILEEAEVFRRGLREGDELVSFAGRTIRSVNQFKNILGIYPKGWKLPLVYRRGDERREIFVRLRALHRESEMNPRMMGAPIPGEPRERPRRRDNPDRDDGDQEEQPQPVPDSPRESSEDTPEKYQHMLEVRSGYANAYFNKVELDRTMSGLSRLGDFRQFTGTWRLRGSGTGLGVAASEGFELTVSESGIGLEWGARLFVQPLDGSELLDEPPGTGGLLLAISHLQKMLVLGKTGFTEYFYLGSEPLDGHGARVDVIVTELEGVNSFWYFQKDSGAFVGFDTTLGENADRCEVRFGEFRTIDGRMFPVNWMIRHADDTVAVFAIQELEMLAAGTGS